MDLSLLHQWLAALVRDAFGGNEALARAQRGAMEAVLNERAGSYSTAELLAAYMDAVLRGKKGGDAAAAAVSAAHEIDTEVVTVMALFQLLMDKDLFSEAHGQHVCAAAARGFTHSVYNHFGPPCARSSQTVCCMTTACPWTLSAM